jgi:anaerobic selenocysteine-containing dehydrogenase
VTFWSRWQQYGGWWKEKSGLSRPAALPVFDQPINIELAHYAGEVQEYPFYLLPFPHPNLGDGSGANRPWLQETPDPMTSAMWNTWVEINPVTARALGVSNDDIVVISSPAGEIEALVYEYPAIRPDVVAVPLGQGHTFLGRYAQGRGSNPVSLLETSQNNSGNLAFMGTRVKITPTGRRRQLSRYESIEGVYGPGK